jgi:hypothetical protein
MMPGLFSDIMGLANPVLGALGTQAAGEQQRKGQNAAMGQLRQGTANSQGFQQPIYDTGLKNYQDLSNQNANGAFSMPKSQAFDGGQFNFQADPGYQFTKGQGEDQINNKAAMGGMAHSPQTTKALMSYDTGLANQTYQDAYNRFNTDRNFNEGAANTAWNQNFAGNNAAFGRGQSLMAPLMGAANNMSQSALGLGQGLAGIEQNKGDISAQLAANPYSMGQGLIGQGQQLIPGLQNFMGGPPMAGNPNSLGNIA